MRARDRESPSRTPQTRDQHKMAADRGVNVHDMVDEYTCFVSQNDPFQLGYIRVNLNKGTGSVYNATG